MRILLVEDNIDFARTIEKAIQAVDGCELKWTKSKTGALTALDDESFDVVILDRRIPTEDDFLDDHQDHGWAVFKSIAENQPGTSVWFLTGTVDPDLPAEVLNAHSRGGDIHCCGRKDPVYKVFWKHKMTECIAAVRAFRIDVQQTEVIHLSQVGTPVNLRVEEVRVLKLFGRNHGGTSIEVQPLIGGLSGARVLRVSVFNASGKPIITSVAKVGHFSEIADERSRYRTEVVKLLPGSFPQVTGDIEFGAACYAGIFYGRVGAEVRSLFDEIAANPEGAALVPTRLQESQATWIGARQRERVRVSTIRRSLIGDVDLQAKPAELEDIDRAAVELVYVDIERCVQHGDLHCANVLFDDRGRPMIIDYRDTGRAIASLDPIVLELSTIFHKNAPNRGGWPSEEQASQWPDINAFCAGAPHEGYLRACRQWALAVAASEQEVWAVGYSYALRQLKYDDTNKVLARAIIRACIERLVPAGGRN